MNNLYLEVLAAGLGGFLAWILTKAVGHVIVRKRLMAYIVTLINTHLAELHGSEPWLDAVKEKTIKADHRIETAAEYTPREVDYLDTVSELSLRHLRKRELLLLAKCEQALWETECLFTGLCRTITVLKEDNTVLTPALVEHLHAKIERIKSYLKKLPHKIDDLTSLPEDYRGVLPPETLVHEDSASSVPPKVRR